MNNLAIIGVAFAMIGALAAIISTLVFPKRDKHEVDDYWQQSDKYLFDEFLPPDGFIGDYYSKNNFVGESDLKE